MVYAKKSPIAEEREAAQMLHVWISREHNSFTKRNMDHQNDAVHRMEHDVKLNPEMGAALTTLGMMSTIEQIIIVTYDILDHIVTRRKDRDAFTNRSMELRHEAYLARKTFVKTIEVAIALKKGDDAIHFDSLKQINDVVTDFYA